MSTSLVLFWMDSNIHILTSRGSRKRHREPPINCLKKFAAVGFEDGAIFEMLFVCTVTDFGENSTF